MLQMRLNRSALQHSVLFRSANYCSHHVLGPKEGAKLAAFLMRGGQNLVKRLDGYATANPEFFAAVTAAVHEAAYPLIEQNVFAGRCVVPHTDATRAVLAGDEAAQMATDILSDRGFRVSTHADDEVLFEVEWDAPKLRAVN